MKSKQQLLAQKVISVCNPDFPTPAMIEFIGKLRFDAVFLDCEHSSTDFHLIADCSRAARLVDLPVHGSRGAVVSRGPHR